MQNIMRRYNPADQVFKRLESNLKNIGQVSNSVTRYLPREVLGYATANPTSYKALTPLIHSTLLELEVRPMDAVIV